MPLSYGSWATKPLPSEMEGLGLVRVSIRIQQHRPLHDTKDTISVCKRAGEAHSELLAKYIPEKLAMRTSAQTPWYYFYDDTSSVGGLNIFSQQIIFKLPNASNTLLVGRCIGKI